MACPLPDVICALPDGVTAHRIFEDELPFKATIRGAPLFKLVADKVKVAVPFPAAAGLLFLLQAIEPARNTERDNTHKKCFINISFAPLRSRPVERLGAIKK